MDDDATRITNRHGPIEARFQARLRKAVASRRIFPFLAGTTFALAIVSGILVTLVDKNEFTNVGDGFWWALVTLATVGYGDFVPNNTPGKIVGSVVILLGVTFLSFLTATVTSLFVSNDQRGETALVMEDAKHYATKNAEALARIEARLDTLEKKLDALDSQ